VREVRERMSALIRKLESPVLTDVRIDWPTAVESYPRQMPDLYAGEPVVLTAAFPPGPVGGTLRLSGRIGAASWEASMPLDGGASQPGVGVLFARDRIESLQDARRNGAAEDDIRREILAVALAHHLVSSATSLVAVDVTPTAPAGVVPVRSGVPGNLPAGLSFDAIGGVPQTATPAALEILVGLLLLGTALAAHVARRRRATTAPRVAGAMPVPAAPSATRGDPTCALQALAHAARRIC